METQGMGFGNRKKTKLGVALAVLVAALAAPLPAAAGMFELSLGFSFYQSQYDDTSFSWTRRWGTSVSYHFTERSGIELAFQDIYERTFIADYQDTNVHDRVTSVNWVQSFLGKNTPFQPYGKLGVGQLNRDIEGIYPTGPSPTTRVDALTGVLGLGFRAFFTKRVAIRAEATSYLQGGSIRTFKDNIAVSIGGSIFF